MIPSGRMDAHTKRDFWDWLSSMVVMVGIYGIAAFVLLWIVWECAGW